MYREPPPPAPIDTLHEVRVWTTSGGGSVALLFALAIIGGVALLVTLVAGAPRELEGTEPLMALSVPLFAIPAYLLHRKRRRAARIVEQGETRSLVVDDADVRLTFPLVLRGSQFTLRMNGIPIREVRLQCIDASGAAVIFKETRGAAHGEHRGWLTNGIDEARGGSTFEIAGVTALGELRSAIEKQNDVMTSAG